MTLDKCIVLRMGTLTGCPVQGKSPRVQVKEPYGNLVMFSFISFRRNINYLLPRLLNFWKPDTLPRITNCYDVHAHMSQHQYLAFFVYIITVYTSLYYILKHKISKRNNIYVCDGKNRPEHFLFIHKSKFHNKKFTASQHPSFQM